MGEQGDHGTMDGSPEAINCLGQEMVKEICHPGGPGNIPKSPVTPGGREGWSPLTRYGEGDEDLWSSPFPLPHPHPLYTQQTAHWQKLGTLAKARVSTGNPSPPQHQPLTHPGVHDLHTRETSPSCTEGDGWQASPHTESWQPRIRPETRTQSQPHQVRAR